MDDIEKLSCKEDILEISDLDNSANDEQADEIPKKKKRRRREIDMKSKATTYGRKKVKLSDDDEDDDTDDETPSKKLLLPLREPRTCVLKASQKRRPLSRLLEQLLRNLEKKDPHQFFAWPVNDNFAPNYSNIIKKPMDFSTIKQKIDDNEYRSLNCFISDFKLMCNNAMKYNKPGTVYHKAAKRLLHAGLKQLAPTKLRPLASLLTYMYEIPIRELGFDVGKMDMQKVLKRSSPIKSGGSEAEAISDGGERSEPGDCVKMKMELAREQHRRRLAKKAFPRMDSEGRTTLCIATRTVEGSGDDRQMTLGQYIGKLTQGTGSLHTLREDRRNLVRGVKPLHYGPFSSYAPSHDGTFASLTRDESRLLYHTLPYEMGESNEETLRFAADSPWAAIYDMEALFPGKKPTDTAATVPDEPDISKMKVDIEKLRSLSDLGIDMEFLNEIEDEVIASQQDYGLSTALKQTAELLARLQQEQTARLSQPPPPHLALAARASPAELGLARGAAGGLRAMCRRVPPRHVAPLAALRAALGLTLHHLDTPMSVDDFIELEMTEPRDTASDPDSRSSHDK